MSLRVCIPTAGTGSRLGELTRFLNKSLVSIANRPTLSHLIEQFPDDTEFVIALGHKGHLVKEFIELAYPQRRFLFAEVQPFEGPGSGLGLSLLACQEYLQQPFIFLSCDTLVREPITDLSRNWMGFAERNELAPYRTLQVDHQRVQAICEKGEGRVPTHKAYIGLAGIVDYQAFWAAMHTGGEHAIAGGEAYGLRYLIDRGIEARAFTWFDTGNPSALEEARNAYKEEDSPNILPKGNEAIWFVDQQVVKFSDDTHFIANRVKRVEEIIDFVPTLTGVRPHMYSYAKVEGKVLSEVVSLPLFDRFLQHCTTFWQRHPLAENAQAHFRSQCMKFYRQKTLERVNLFYSTFDTQDTTTPINDVAMPRLASLLDQVGWEALADGLAGRFHGDFHFENILWSEKTQVFTFLDWRQDFGGSLSVGDIYYDLAKLLHGLIVCHELIARDHYQVNWQADNIRYDFHRKQILVQCEQHFYQWLHAQGYDVGKVRVLTALIYLNIAALHHAPYSHMLYALGKSMLHECLHQRAG